MNIRKSSFLFLIILVFSLSLLNALPSLNSSNITGAVYNGTDYFFSPNDDGLYDEIVIIMNASELIQDWGTTRIFNSTGESIKSFSSPFGSPDNITSLIKHWDGTSPDFNEGFVPEGKYTINTTITNPQNETSTITVATIFVDTSSPEIKDFFPSKKKDIIKTDVSKIFNVSMTDLSNILYYEWFINGSKTGVNSSTYNLSSDKEGEFNITVKIIDLVNNSVSNEWNTIVIKLPLTKNFTNSETTNLSKISNISFVQNFKLANSNGKIDFGDNVLDLSNVLDIDSAVEIEEGIVAINSSKYSELNVSANITLTGLNYDSVPTIYYNEGFTTNSDEINEECEFCEILGYTEFPTTSGTVTFSVKHFSSFLVGESGEEYDLEQFDDLNLCKNGTIGNLNLEIRDPKEGDDFELDEIIKIDSSVKNQNDEDKDIVFEAVLYNIDEDDIEEESSKDESIDENDDLDFEFEIPVPKNFDDSDDYIIFVKAYEDNNEDEQCVQGAVGIDLNREDHEVIISQSSISQDTAYPGDSVNLFVDVKNIGESDEDVYVVIENTQLGIYEETEIFELEKFSDKDFSSQVFFVSIPEDSKEGEYNIKVSVIFDEGSDVITETINILSLGIHEIKPVSISSINEQTSNVKNQTIILLTLFAGIIFLLLLMVMILPKRKNRERFKKSIQTIK